MVPVVCTSCSIHVACEGETASACPVRFLGHATPLIATANYTNEEKDYPMEGYYYYYCLVCLVVVVRNFYSNFYKFPGFITEPLIVGPHFTSNLSQRRKDAAGQWWTRVDYFIHGRIESLSSSI